MILSANDLLGWKDFPKGLRVLLLEEDSNSAAEIRSKLEEMDYIVSTFYNENEALSAVSNSADGFHIAIVEVSMDNSDGRFKFLQNAKDLPTIMTSDMHCLSTMMKCIALGAVAFLSKPLCQEKLRNIWQHAVHKAFNAGGKDLSESLKPVKESVTSMLQLKLENGESDNQISIETEHETQIQENIQEISAGSDKYPAPSTPQIKRGVRLLEDGDCQDQTNILTYKETMEQDGESKSVETTVQMSPTRGLGEADDKEEDNLDTAYKDKFNASPPCLNKCSPGNFGGDAKKHRKASRLHNLCGFRSNRNKMKKYRMQQRHILPKEDVRKWPHPRESTQRSYYSHKPVLAFPPYHSAPVLPGSQVYLAWVPPSSYPAGAQIWGSPYYPAWQSTENWHWKPYPEMHADAWGCPMMPPSVGPCSPFPQAEEVIDKVVKEAITKPWLALPLGLKPPSTDSVLTELSKQGISFIPPHINDMHSR